MFFFHYFKSLLSKAKSFNMLNKLPLVVILGSTGSGKTKLSIELAEKFGGEVIGADSMQVYRALDIITAKATQEERAYIPHHLIDILDPQETFTVLEYRNQALKLIETIWEKGKMPIIVGGTNYYIEALLWKILLDDNIELVKSSRLLDKYHELPSEHLHEKLKVLDPAMAKRLHPNNRRKIFRALEVLEQKGRKLSDILAKQQAAKDGSKSGGGLRFPNSLVFWLQADQHILDKRLDDRVDGMIDHGLLNELLHFHKIYNERRVSSNNQVDYTKGVFQSIGFKEFHTYLMMSEAERLSPKGHQELQKGIEQLKIATRRYSRKQKRWITNRFLGRSDRQVPKLFGLDISDLSKWNSNVTEISETIVQSFINGTVCPYEPLPKIIKESTPNSEEETYKCLVCDRIFIGEYQWTIHLKSKNHKFKALKEQRKQK